MHLELPIHLKKIIKNLDLFFLIIKKLIQILYLKNKNITTTTDIKLLKIVK